MVEQALCRFFFLTIFHFVLTLLLLCIFWPVIFIFPVLTISSLPSLVPHWSPAVHSLSATAPRSAAGWCSTTSWRWVHCQPPEDASPPTQSFICSVFAKHCSQGEKNNFSLFCRVWSLLTAVLKKRVTFLQLTPALQSRWNMRMNPPVVVLSLWKNRWPYF